MTEGRGDIDDIARRIASYADGQMRRNVFLAAKQELAALTPVTPALGREGIHLSRVEFDRLNDRLANLSIGLEEIRDALWSGDDAIERIRKCADRWLSGREEALDAHMRASLSHPTQGADKALREALEKRIAEIHDHAVMANGAIRLNRDGGGNGRVKVATCMHHIERISADVLAALASTSNGGEK